MTTKDVLQLAASLVVPFIAAGGALWIASQQRKERVSCFISWGYGRGGQEVSLVGIHNRSSQTVAITRIRYLSGIVIRSAAEGTALNYDDPTDLGFPYLVAPGEIRTIELDQHMAGRLARSFGKGRLFLARLFRRSRILVECQTTTGARYRASAETVLPWSDQLSWKRG